MSSEINDLTEEELQEKGKQLLKDLGIENPTVGETHTISSPNTGEFEVIDTKIRETTRPVQKALNQFPRRGDERVVNNLYPRPLCNVLGCGAISLLPGQCKKTSEEYVDPVIDFQNAPRKLKNVTVHIDTDPRISGDVEVGANNFSEPGEVITTTKYKCSSNEEDVEVVDESAILDMDSEHNIVDATADEVIDTVQSTIPDIGPEASKTTDVEFVKRGAVSSIRGLIQNWTTGTMRGQIDGTIDIQYEWKNSTKNQTFDISTTATLPVEGDLDIDLF